MIRGRCFHLFPFPVNDTPTRLGMHDMTTWAGTQASTRPATYQQHRHDKVRPCSLPANGGMPINERKQPIQAGTLHRRHSAAAREQMVGGPTLACAHFRHALDKHNLA